MKLDNKTSTISFAGRRFPAVCVICPPNGDQDPDNDWDRMLGGPGGPGTIDAPLRYQVLIPCENGILVGVEEFEGRDGYQIGLHARTCRLEPWDDQEIYIPHYVAIDHGELITRPDRDPRTRRIFVPPGVWHWDGAEPEWTAELIDRIDRMSFAQPPGPEVRLITLAEAERLYEEHRYNESSPVPGQAGGID